MFPWQRAKGKRGWPLNPPRNKPGRDRGSNREITWRAGMHLRSHFGDEGADPNG